MHATTAVGCERPVPLIPPTSAAQVARQKRKISILLVVSYDECSNRSLNEKVIFDIEDTMIAISYSYKYSCHHTAAATGCSWSIPLLLLVVLCLVLRGGGGGLARLAAHIRWRESRRRVVGVLAICCHVEGEGFGTGGASEFFLLLAMRPNSHVSVYNSSILYFTPCCTWYLSQENYYCCIFDGFRGWVLKGVRGQGVHCGGVIMWRRVSDDPDVSYYQ